MELFPAAVDPLSLLICLAVALLAGVIKGMVGFAMPMIMISGMGSVIPPELALAGLILPTLVTNGMQALRQGLRAALGSTYRFRLFLMVGFVMLMASAQLVPVLPQAAMLAIIGVPIVLFALSQLAGIPLRLPKNPGPRTEAGVAAFAGFLGGLSGIWGPPTVAYLTAMDTPKTEQVRVQGVIYGLGAVALFFAHLGSGVVRAETVPFSLAVTVPAVLGMWLGFKLHDRIDQGVFRKATLLVLLIAGLNLVRRGLLG